MKISIIIPVYNEQETIAQCLEALLGQDYPQQDYEIIVVNDGSCDNTGQIIERYPVRLINQENSGRLIARQRGAQEARYEDLLFIDSRVIAAKNLLSSIESINYQPLMAGEHNEDKYRCAFDTLFYLIRKKLYAPYYPQRDWGKELWIDEANFDKAPKGMTCFFCERRLFLQSLPDTKGKSVNDDTRMLRVMVKERKILRHTDLSINYLQRSDWKTVLRHIYERGPRFSDYYLKGQSRYYRFWQAGLLLFLTILVSAFYSPLVLLYALLSILFALICLGLILAENVRDFFIVLLYFPPIVTAFCAGIIKGKLSFGRTVE